MIDVGINLDKERIQMAEDSLSAYKKRIEKFLVDYLSTKVSVFKGVAPLGEETGKLIKNFILDGGKRIRAAFTYYGYCTTDGKDGEDGDDGENASFIDTIYYCETRNEITLALDDIGTGGGTIIITKSIPDLSTISLTQGGSYIFQGVGGVTLTPTLRAFEVSNVKSCIIRDLTIDGSQTNPTDILIYITEANDNPVSIQNVQIIGNNPDGIGIRTVTNNVLIEDCYLEGLNHGIYISGTARNCRVMGNSLYNISNNAIYLLDGGASHVIEGNIINKTGVGIQMSCDFSSIGNNVITYLAGTGIHVTQGSGNQVTGNSVYYDDNQNDAGNIFGILLSVNANYNSITGNGIYSIFNAGSGIGYGMNITTTCIQNVITGNNLYNNEDNTINDNSVNNIVANNNEG